MEYLKHDIHNKSGKYVLGKAMYLLPIYIITEFCDNSPPQSLLNDLRQLFLCVLGRVAFVLLLF